jgi:signal transduction histidine kinase
MKNLKRIENLVQKVESFSHLPSPSLREMQFKEVIDDALQPYLHRIEEQNIELTMSLEQPGVRADKNLVLRVFSILIENALDAMPESGSIAIRGETRGNDFIIEVTDTGTGISPKDLPYIFNPFFSTKANGAGIDLAIVKRVMESHGGEVEVESKAGEGASFLLRFPLERRRAIRITRLQDSCGAEAEKIRK